MLEYHGAHEQISYIEDDERQQAVIRCLDQFEYHFGLSVDSTKQSNSEVFVCSFNDYEQKEDVNEIFIWMCFIHLEEKKHSLQFIIKQRIILR